MPSRDRRSLLIAALGFALLEPKHRELRLLHSWLSTWTGIGHVIVGMKRQGYEVSMGDHAGQWIAVFYEGHTTKIPWFDGRRQAELTRGGFMKVAGVAEPKEMRPTVEHPKPALLQMADVYAYMAAQAHRDGGGRKIGWFRDLYRLIGPDRARIQWNPNPQWESTTESPPESGA